MSPETVIETLNVTDEIDWQPPQPPTDLIFDDGEPLESNRHRIAMNVLIHSLEQAWANRHDFFVGGNMFIYYSSAQVKNRDFRGPDFFAVLDVDSNPSRQGWVVWEEGGRYPDVIVELLSPSTATIDKVAKKHLYETVFKTTDYFIYDPFNADSLQGWHLGSDRRYQPLTVNSQGWLWCDTLKLWLGTWEGAISREPASWLRFYDQTGQLIPLPAEAAQQQAEVNRQQAEVAQQQAEVNRQQAEAAQQQAEIAQQQAEAAQQQAEVNRQQAEVAQQQAEADRQRAEVAQQRGDRLAARLRELGEDPEQMS